MQKTIAKINLKAIKNNAEAFKTLTGKKLCAVVKANAYGHGALATVNALESVADFFAVALIEEALEIRQAVCDKEILVLTPPTDISEVVYLFDERFIASVGDLKTAKLIQRVAFLRKKKIKVHLKLSASLLDKQIHAVDGGTHWFQVLSFFGPVFSFSYYIKELRKRYPVKRETTAPTKIFPS